MARCSTTTVPRQLADLAGPPVHIKTDDAPLAPPRTPSEGGYRTEVTATQRAVRWLRRRRWRRWRQRAREGRGAVVREGNYSERARTTWRGGHLARVVSGWPLRFPPNSRARNRWPVTRWSTSRCVSHLTRCPRPGGCRAVKQKRSWYAYMIIKYILQWRERWVIGFSVISFLQDVILCNTYFVKIGTVKPPYNGSRTQPMFPFTSSYRYTTFKKRKIFKTPLLLFSVIRRFPSFYTVSVIRRFYHVTACTTWATMFSCVAHVKSKILVNIMETSKYSIKCMWSNISASKSLSIHIF